MLVCAVLASLAAGVLAAYGVCLFVLTLFRPRALAPAKQPAIPAASPTTAVEG
ncbi:MAG TPA: hypothetical protein VGU46_05400 [Acidobacteriaceae bacterium]|nr:hypothetical protein [Acidobacteriaceae bacterium]